MSNNSECCALLKPIYYFFYSIFQLEDTYKEVYKMRYSNEIVPEIWSKSWILWRNRVIKQCNKEYIKSFIYGLFNFLKINHVYYDDMDDYEINSYVNNKKQYFPSNSYLKVQVIIPGIVYRISLINEKIHIRYGKLKIMNIYKKYVMRISYYRNEETPLRVKSKNTDVIIGDWVLTDSFYYDYKNPVDTFQVPS